MTKNWSPLILLAINNGAGSAENLDQRNHTQDNEYQPDDFITFENFYSYFLYPGL